MFILTSLLTFLIHFQKSVIHRSRAWIDLPLVCVFSSPLKKFSSSHNLFL